MKHKPLLEVYKNKEKIEAINKKKDKETDDMKKDINVMNADITELYMDNVILKDKFDHIEKYLKKNKDYKPYDKIKETNDVKEIKLKKEK